MGPEALVGLHQEKCDTKTIQHTCSLFGLDLERPPPLPPSRSYTVAGNSKLGYPQTRIMKSTFPEDANGDVVLRGGEVVLVVGASNRVTCWSSTTTTTSTSPINSSSSNPTNRVSKSNYNH